MRGAVLYEYNAPLKIEEFEQGEPAAGQVLVRMMAGGVCHSDYHVIKGDWPHLPIPTIVGHEGAGIVEAVGPGVNTVQVGDHVILTWKLSCGICEMCQRGFPNLCDVPFESLGSPRVRETGQEIERMVGLGAFSTSTIVSQSAVVSIDRDIPFEQAALVGCAVTTGVGAVVNTAGVPAGYSVAVFGCGGVGLNCVQGARLVGAEPIIAVDILDNKLEMARTFGATHTVNASREDPVARIQEVTGGAGAHYAFECIGISGETILQAILCTRKRGVTVIVGMAPFGTVVDLDARALIHEKTVMGSYYGTARPHVDFPRYLGLYKAGKLKLDELITCTYPLEQVNEAFAALARGEVARSVLKLSS